MVHTSQSQDSNIFFSNKLSFLVLTVGTRGYLVIFLGNILHFEDVLVSSRECERAYC